MTYACRTIPALRRARPDVVIALFVVLVAGCAARPQSLPVESADYHLLASMRTGGSGFLFYVHSVGPGTAGPLLEGYELRDGRVVDSFDGGSESASVVETIAKIGLRPFDYDREVERVTALLRAQATARGEEFLAPGTRDGAEWDIQISTAGGKFALRAWNPGFIIDAYAGHSDHIRMLKATIDLLAQYYGRLKLGL